MDPLSEVLSPLKPKSYLADAARGGVGWLSALADQRMSGAIAHDDDALYLLRSYS